MFFLKKKECEVFLLGVLLVVLVAWNFMEQKSDTRNIAILIGFFKEHCHLLICRPILHCTWQSFWSKAKTAVPSKRRTFYSYICSLIHSTVECRSAHSIVECHSVFVLRPFGSLGWAGGMEWNQFFFISWPPDLTGQTFFFAPGTVVRVRQSRRMLGTRPGACQCASTPLWNWHSTLEPSLLALANIYICRYDA